MCTDVVVQCSIGKVGERWVGFSLGADDNQGPNSLCAPVHGITCSEDSDDTQAYQQCQWCFTGQCNKSPAMGFVWVCTSVFV